MNQVGFKGLKQTTKLKLLRIVRLGIPCSSEHNWGSFDIVMVKDKERTPTSDATYVKKFNYICLKCGKQLLSDYVIKFSK
jgi:hypothetical protein